MARKRRLFSGITPRFTEGEVSDAVRPLHERLARLEAENRELRTRLDQSGDPR